MAADRTKTPTKHTAHEKYVSQVRAEGRWCSPFRLGNAVGAAGDSLPSPYPPGSKSDHSYLDGLEYGRTERTINAKSRELYEGSVSSTRLGWDELTGGERWPWREKAIQALTGNAGVPGTSGGQNNG